MAEQKGTDTKPSTHIMVPLLPTPFFSHLNLPSHTTHPPHPTFEKFSFHILSVTFISPRHMLTFVQEAGIVIQGAGNIVFSIVALMLWHRTRVNSRRQGIPTPFPKTAKFKLFVAAIVISDLAIILRAIYRVIELAQGWSGYLITTEPWFYGFDTALMIICMGVWVVGHPGITLGPELARSNLRERRKVESPSTSEDDLNKA